MKITADEIRAKVTSIWPDLEYIWLWDKAFWMPPLGAVEGALKTSNVPTMQFIESFCDCDDFALQFVAEVRRKRYMQWASGKLPQDHQFPISIGRAFGDMFRGISKVHMANICLCQEGVYMLDATPGERRIWEAKPENDNLIYVDM
jgi:hypothetical protein